MQCCAGGSMCPHFQGKEQWALLLCDMQSANRWLCCDFSLRSERYAATKRIPMNGLIQGCQRPAGLSGRSDRPETWPDLSGRTPGMSGRTTLPSSLCQYACSIRLKRIRLFLRLLLSGSKLFQTRICGNTIPRNS